MPSPRRTAHVLPALLLALSLAPAGAGGQSRTAPPSTPRSGSTAPDRGALDLGALGLGDLDLSALDLPRLDPDALRSGSADLLTRAADPDLDRLFQALHRAARTPADAEVLCGVFDPQADRSPEALTRAAQQLGEDSRQGFLDALLRIALGGLQNPPQAYDAGAAKQTLKRAGATALLLHDDFAAQLGAEGQAPQARQARCRAFGWVLDALAQMPMAQRAAATRLLLHEGLARGLPSER
ncbi:MULTISPECIES: hypothetical protein [Lysobacter]|uniref:Uncharacterized protein n=1 Tax=Lysobacter firmicutimachus TaxID=1792846 RepID=A0ABU8D435_9GAMM|nr:hypothetical protein [Lysobacter antibioticus]